MLRPSSLFPSPGALSALLSLPISSEEAEGQSKAKTTRGANQAGLDSDGITVSDKRY